MTTKYVVWVKEDGTWQPNGDGAMTEKQATRVASEIKRDCRVPAKVVPEGVIP